MGELFHEEKFDMYTVKVAGKHDIDTVVQLLRSAAFWLQDKGVDQWEYLRTGDGDGEIRQDILDGMTYLVVDTNGSAVATFNLSPKQNSWDVAIWGTRNDNAYYLHRLTVNRNRHNNQVGRRLLRWIDANNSIQNGYIRLDCVANNPILNRYYLEAGYTFIGYAGEEDDKLSKYEKVILS